MLPVGKFSRFPRIARLMSAILVLVMLASACRPAPTPVPTEPPQAVPTQPPAPTAKPTEIEPTEEPAPAEDLAPQLRDKKWLLVAFGDAANPTVVEEGTVVTALFSEDGILSGSGGCNNFSTSWELTGDELSVGVIASTMMACDRGMEQETAVLAALQSAQRIAFTDEGRLEVFYNVGSDGERKLVYTAGETPLVDTVWVLQSMGATESPTAVESGTIITAIFTEEGSLSGSSGCNTYAGGFILQDDQIDVEQPISTMMACDRGMEQETAYLTALTAAETFRIVGSRLEISYQGGKSMLVFTSRNLTLENTLWTLAMVNGERNTVGLVATTALFDPGTEPQKGAVGGVAMCNNYRGSYTTEPGVVQVTELASTKIRCPEAVAQAETTYFELLETAQTYQVLGDTLMVTSEKGTLTFVANRAPLEGTYWRLNSLGAADKPQTPVEGADFTALFARQPEVPSGMIMGATGCNDYNATYAANLNEIKVNLPVRTNNPGCSPALTVQENLYFLALNAASNFRILGDNLQIPYGDGEMLNFTAFVPVAAPEPSGGPLTGLNGTRWWLVMMGPTVVLPGTAVTAEFAINADGETGAITGSAGCNNYNASILSVFQVSPPASTKMLCSNPAGLMNQETSYLAMLATANSFSQAFNQLLIGTTSGLLVYHNGPAPVFPVEPTPEAPGKPPASPTPESTAESTPEATPEMPTAEPTAEPTEEPQITPAPPEAMITAPTEGVVDQAVTFDASASASEAEIAAYSWDFGDGAQADGVSVEHAFTAPGTYTVTLTVTDVYGQVGTATLTIKIT